MTKQLLQPNYKHDFFVNYINLMADEYNYVSEKNFTELLAIMKMILSDNFFDYAIYFEPLIVKGYLINPLKKITEIYVKQYETDEYYQQIYTMEDMIL